MSTPPIAGHTTLSARVAPRTWCGALVVACAAWLASPTAVDAQRPDSTRTARPAVGPLAPACCKVVAIDSASRTVTARETATAYAFRFHVYEPRVFAELEIGDPVWADFVSRTVRVVATDPEPCCTIIAAAPSDAPRRTPRPTPDDLFSGIPTFDRH